ncbi:MAG: sporulation protein YqfD [Oscillospiraceae bacterium]|nr:sporulation protein YqfD [Oscillospiraceae bacterium]
MILQEYCDIRVTGRNPYPFVNALRESPVACGEQRCAGDVFSGRICRRDLEEVRRLAAQCGMAVDVQEVHSLGGKLRKFRLRYGLLAGFLLGAMLIFYQSNVVETVEIQGAASVDVQKIEAVLAEEGVRRGTWIGDIDLYRCEQRIFTSFREVAWVGMRHTGNRLVVEIAEVKPKTDYLYERMPSNIVSGYDAQITGICVRSGRLCHGKGDGVAKGELLVSGVWTNDEGRSFYTHANADITGIFTRKAELSEYLDQTETRPTGRTFLRKRLRIFGVRLPLTAGKADYPESRTHTTETPLCFLGFTLPCSIEQELTEELETTESTRSADDARLQLNADIVRFEKNLLRDVTILDREIRYRTDEDAVTAELTYRLEGEIGMQSEIFAK